MIAAGGGLGSQGTRLRYRPAGRLVDPALLGGGDVAQQRPGAPVAGVEHRYWASWSGGPWPVWMQELLGLLRKVTVVAGRSCNSRSAAMLRV